MVPLILYWGLAVNPIHPTPQKNRAPGGTSSPGNVHSPTVGNSPVGPSQRVQDTPDLSGEARPGFTRFRVPGPSPETGRKREKGSETHPRRQSEKASQTHPRRQRGERRVHTTGVVKWSTEKGRSHWILPPTRTMTPGRTVWVGTLAPLSRSTECGGGGTRSRRT